MKFVGVDGADGQDGQDGAIGKSAYQSALDNGFVGTEAQWLASLKGEKGADGVAGQNAPNAKIQYSADNVNFHDAFVAGDKYLRISVDNGITWSSGMKFVGVDGADGQDGQDGADGQNATINGYNAITIVVEDGLSISQEQGTITISSPNLANKADKEELKGLMTKIAQIEQGSSFFTGNADVAGLQAIGWNDADIAHFQKWGVNWMAEDDDFNKVSDYNKSLYGQVTWDNVANYKNDAGMVYLPKIYPPSTPNSCANKFNGFKLVQHIAVDGWEFGQITSLEKMFYQCEKLRTFGDWNDRNLASATTCNQMFTSCKALTLVEIKNLALPLCTDCASMFYGCSSATSFNLSNWNVSSVTTMLYMFYGCSLATGFNLSNWNVSSVTTMAYMFYGCSSATSFNLSNWNVSSVTTMAAMFSNCSSATSFNLSNWNVSSVTTMASMFSSCSSATSFNLSNWNVSSVTNMSYMFYGCSFATSFNFSNWNVSSVTNMSYMFFGCSFATEIDLTGWVTTSLTSANYMYQNCSLLMTLPYMVVSSTTSDSLYQIVKNCNALQHITSSSTIRNDIAFLECPLTASSVLIVLNALDLNVSGKQVAFKTGLYATYTAAEKAAIDTARNAAVAAGWTVVNMS
jgi:surface protein